MVHGVSAVRSRAARLVGGALLGLVAPALIVSCANRDRTEDRGDAPHEEAPGGATVALILENPTQHYGKTVTVSGEVAELHGPRAFTLGGPDWLSGELLVLAAEPLPPVRGREGNAQLAKGDLVQVTGPVRRVVIADIEREIGFDLDRELEKAFENKPAVVVKSQSMQITPHKRQAALIDLTPKRAEGQVDTGQSMDMSAKDAGATDAGPRDGGQRDAAPKSSADRRGTFQ